MSQLLLEENRLDVGREDTSSSANCSIVGLLPFTSPRRPLHLAYEHALAMLLAIDHLNRGDGSLVPAISGLSDKCPITFSASFADTRRPPSYGFETIDSLTRPTNAEDPIPCAFLGATDSEMSKITAMVSGMRGFPQISPSSTSDGLNDNAEFPLFARTVSDDSFLAEIFVRFLHDSLNVRHFYVIYESHAYTRSLKKNIREAIYKLGWTPQANDGNSDVGDDYEIDGNLKEQIEAMYMKEYLIEISSEDSVGGVEEAIEDLIRSKYRFVVVLTTRSSVSDDIMERAYQKRLAGTGVHHWWFSDTFSGTVLGRTFEKDSVLAKAYDGAGSIQPDSDFDGKPYRSFVEQSILLKRQLYASNRDVLFDMATKTELPVLQEADWLSEDEGYFGNYPAYSYDATVLLGLSACNEIAGTTSPLHLSGKAFFDRMTQTNFTGITGDIHLYDSDHHRSGTRDGHSVHYSIKNWRTRVHNHTNDTIEFRGRTTHRYLPHGHDDWDTVDTFFFNGGNDALPFDPGLPPFEPKQNVVDQWIKGLGLLLCSIVLIATLGFTIWTCKNRKSRVVLASQPFFLYLLCFGIAIMACSMIPMSLSHSVVNNPYVVCNSVVWLFALGFGVTFSTLFSKTYRINRIMAKAMKCQRIKLTIQDTIYPVALICGFNIIMLSFMTRYQPLRPGEFFTGEDEFGRPSEVYYRCIYSEALDFLGIITAVNLGMVCLALVQAWRARNLSTEFAESSHIANALGISFVASVLACPVLILVKENPDANTFLITSLVFVLTTTTLCFIFIPKVIFHRKLEKGRTDRSETMERISRLTLESTGASLKGDRILTTKSRDKLALEVKSLERELVLSRQREETLMEKNKDLCELLTRSNSYGSESAILRRSSKPTAITFVGETKAMGHIPTETSELTDFRVEDTSMQ